MTSSTPKENHTMRTTLGGAALLLTIATAATGCSGGSTATTTPNSAPPSAAPSDPATSAAPQSPKDRADAAAEAAMRRYVATTNAVARKPRTLTRLKKVAAGSALLDQQNEARYFIRSGYHGEGAGTRIVKMEPAAAALGEKPPYVQLNVCTSFAGKLVDHAGQTVDVGKRPKYRTSLYTVANYGKLGWLVAVQKDNDNGSSSCEL